MSEEQQHAVVAEDAQTPVPNDDDDNNRRQPAPAPAILSVHLALVKASTTVAAEANKVEEGRKEDTRIQEQVRKDAEDAEVAMAKRSLSLQLSKMKQSSSSSCRQEAVGPIVARATRDPVKETHEGTRVCNVALIGDSGVGKTTLAMCFLEEAPQRTATTATVGVDFKSKMVRLPDTNESASLHLWDTAGSERYNSITASYFRRKDAFIIVYAVDDPRSFDHVLQWARAAESKSPDALKFIIANKDDMRETTTSQVVTIERVTAMKILIGAKDVFVTSATENYEVSEAFQKITNAIFGQGEYAHRAKVPRDDLSSSTAAAVDRPHRIQRSKSEYPTKLNKTFTSWKDSAMIERRRPSPLQQLPPPPPPKVVEKRDEATGNDEPFMLVVLEEEEVATFRDGGGTAASLDAKRRRGSCC